MFWIKKSFLCNACFKLHVLLPMRSKSPASDYLWIKSSSPNFLRKMNHSNFLRKNRPGVRCHAIPCDPWFPVCLVVFQRDKPNVNRSGSTASQAEFLQNLRLNLIDLSRRLEQDRSDDVTDYVLYRLQQVASHLSRIAGRVSGNVTLAGWSYINFGGRRTQLAACTHCFVFYGIGWSTQVWNKQRSAWVFRWVRVDMSRYRWGSSSMCYI